MIAAICKSISLTMKSSWVEEIGKTSCYELFWFQSVASHYRPFQSQWGLYQYVNTPEGASQYYANIANPTIVVKTTIYVLQTSLADIVIIWQCYVVYTKKWYMIVPPAAVVIVNMCKFYTELDGLKSHLVGIVGARFYITWVVSQAHPGSNIFQIPATRITTLFILTMCVNISCTGESSSVGRLAETHWHTLEPTATIAWRIYWTAHRSGSAVGLFPVLAVIVESGALYAASVHDGLKQSIPCFGCDSTCRGMYK